MANSVLICFVPIDLALADGCTLAVKQRRLHRAWRIKRRNSHPASKVAKLPSITIRLRSKELRRVFPLFA